MEWTHVYGDIQYAAYDGRSKYRPSTKKRMRHFFMEGIFWTVFKDGKALTRWSRHRMAAAAEEGV